MKRSSTKKDENCNNVKNMITFSFKMEYNVDRIAYQVNYIFAPVKEIY